MPEPLCFRSGVGSVRSCGPRQPDPRRGRRLDGGEVGVQVTHSVTAEHDFRSPLAARVATLDTSLHKPVPTGSSNASGDQRRSPASSR